MEEGVEVERLTWLAMLCAQILRLLLRQQQDARSHNLVLRF